MQILDKFRPFQSLLIFLAMAGTVIANQEIPEISDPAIVPMTFLEQERAIVLTYLKHTQLKGHETILHLGCRDGYLSNEIAKYLPEGRVIGLENIFAQEPQINSNNISFLQAKFVEQDWQNCYDYIICTQFDEWDDNPDELFCAIRNALKPGGIAIILICTDMALPAANPLKKWLKKPENQEYVASLRFWNNIDFAEFRDLMRKYRDIRKMDGGMPRMIACFRDLEQFKEEARKWFRKIALLPMPLQELSLNPLVAVTKNRGTLNVSGVSYYEFRYTLEIACCRKGN